MRLATKIGPAYFELGVLLDLGADVTKGIEKNYRDNATRCAFEVLNTWRQNLDGNLGSKATYKTLCQVLIDLKRKDLVKVLRSGE